jgi:hypothetical protein
LPQLIFELLVAIPRVDVQIGGNIHEKRSMRLQYLSEFGEILRGRLPYEYNEIMHRSSDRKEKGNE